MRQYTPTPRENSRLERAGKLETVANAIGTFLVINGASVAGAGIYYSNKDLIYAGSGMLASSIIAFTTVLLTSKYKIKKLKRGLGFD